MRIKILDKLFVQLLNEDFYRHKPYKYSRISWVDYAENALDRKTLILSKNIDQTLHFQEYKRTMIQSTMEELYKLIAERQINTDKKVNELYNRIDAIKNAKLYEMVESAGIYDHANIMIMKTAIMEACTEQVHVNLPIKCATFNKIKSKIFGDKKEYKNIKYKLYKDRLELDIEKLADQPPIIMIFAKAFNELLRDNLIIALPQIIHESPKEINIDELKVTKERHVISTFIGNNRIKPLRIADLKLQSSLNNLLFTRITESNNFMNLISQSSPGTIEVPIEDEDGNVHTNLKYTDIVQMIIIRDIKNEEDTKRKLPVQKSPNFRRLLGHYFGYEFTDIYYRSFKQIGNGYIGSFIENRNAFVASELLYNLSYSYANINKDIESLAEYKRKTTDTLAEILHTILSHQYIDTTKLTNFIIHGDKNNSGIESIINEFITKAENIAKNSEGDLYTFQSDIFELIDKKSHEAYEIFKNQLQHNAGKMSSVGIEIDDIIDSVRIILHAQYKYDGKTLRNIDFRISPITASVVLTDKDILSTVKFGDTNVTVYFNDEKEKAVFDSEDINSYHHKLVQAWVELIKFVDIQKSYTSPSDTQKLRTRINGLLENNVMPMMIQDILDMIDTYTSVKFSGLSTDIIEQIENAIDRIDEEVFKSLFNTLASYVSVHSKQAKIEMSNNLLEQPVFLADLSNHNGFTSYDWKIMAGINPNEPERWYINLGNEVTLTIDNIKEAVENNRIYDIDSDDSLINEWKQSCIGKGIMVKGVFNPKMDHFYSMPDMFKFLGTKILKVDISSQIADGKSLDGSTLVTDNKYILILLPFMSYVQTGDEMAFYKAIYRKEILPIIDATKISGSYLGDNIENQNAIAVAQRVFLSSYIFKGAYVKRKEIQRRNVDRLDEIVKANKEMMEKIGKDYLESCRKEGIFKDAYESNEEAYDMMLDILDKTKKKIDLTYNSLNNGYVDTAYQGNFTKIFQELAYDIEESLKSGTINLEKYDLTALGIVDDQMIKVDLDELKWDEGDVVRDALSKLSQDSLTRTIYMNLDNIISYLISKSSDNVQKVTMSLKNDEYNISPELIEQFADTYNSVRSDLGLLKMDGSKAIGIIRQYITKKLAEKQIELKKIDKSIKNNIRLFSNNDIDAAIKSIDKESMNYILYNKESKRAIIPEMAIEIEKHITNTPKSKWKPHPPSNMKMGKKNIKVGINKLKKQLQKITDENKLKKYLENDRNAINRLLKNINIQDIYNEISDVPQENQDIFKNWIEKEFRIKTTSKQQTSNYVLNIQVIKDKFVLIDTNNFEEISTQEIYTPQNIDDIYKGLSLSSLYFAIYLYINNITPQERLSSNIQRIIGKLREIYRGFMALIKLDIPVSELNKLKDNLINYITALELYPSYEKQAVDFTNIDDIMKNPNNIKFINILRRDDALYEVIEKFILTIVTDEASSKEEEQGDSLQQLLLNNISIMEPIKGFIPMINKAPQTDEQQAIDISKYPSIRTLVSFVATMDDNGKMKPNQEMYYEYIEIINKVRESLERAKDKYYELFKRFTENINIDDFYEDYLDMIYKLPISIKRSHSNYDIYDRTIAVYPQIIVDNMMRYYYYTALARLRLATLGRGRNR